MTLCFEVEDTGIGIYENELQNIFSEFHQADNSTTRKFGGTGLGLSISQKLCVLLGSKIEVKSQIGQGSKFYFSLVTEIGKVVKQDDVPIELNLSLDKYSILLVEDNEINLQLAKEHLTRLGVSPDLARDGEQAVAACQSTHYDIIFMDCSMPVLDGYSATKKIRELPLDHQPRIVALTANAMSDDREKCINAGMDDYLSKPISGKKLRNFFAKNFANTKNKKVSNS